MYTPGTLKKAKCTLLSRSLLEHGRFRADCLALPLGLTPSFAVAQQRRPPLSDTFFKSVVDKCASCVSSHVQLLHRRITFKLLEGTRPPWPPPSLHPRGNITTCVYITSLPIWNIRPQPKQPSGNKCCFELDLRVLALLYSRCASRYISAPWISRTHFKLFTFSFSGWRVT